MGEVKQLFSEEDIQQRISQTGAKIRESAGDQRILLIGILKGSSVFLADVLRAIPGNVHYEWVNVLRDVADTDTAEAMEIDFLTQFDMRDQYVYVLKDVVTTGVIESYLLTQFREKHPADIKLVALLDCPAERKLDLHCDYSVFQTDRTIFVGYGLESPERTMGNLPFIGTLK